MSTLARAEGRPSSAQPPARRPVIQLGTVLWASPLFLVAALTAAFWVRSPPRRFAAVEPGVLYRSGQPSPRQLARLIERYRLRTVINLRGSVRRYWRTSTDSLSDALPLAATGPVSPVR